MKILELVVALLSKLPPEAGVLLTRFIKDLLAAPPDEALERLRQSALATASRKAFKRK
jgi:hypothetical protein